jgi:hypothetical protein
VKPRQLLNRLSASSSMGSAEIHRPNVYTHSVHGSAQAASTAFDPLLPYKIGPMNGR